MTAQARIRYPSKSAIARAVEAARALGLDVVGFEVAPNGSIKVIDAKAVPRQAISDFDRYEAEL